MGTKYSSQATSGYNSSPPPDDGTQVAANLVTWAGVKTKLADVLKTFAEAINTALVSALDLSARAISSNDTAVATDHWKTLQVTGTTTISLSSAASMGAGYEVGVCNAGTLAVTVTPAGSDTINGLSASVVVPIRGTMIFRTNQALTGYNVVGSGGNWVVNNGGFLATSNGHGFGYGDSASGLIIYGQGSVADVTILNKNGASALTVPTNTTTIQLSGALIGPATMLSPITNSLGADVSLNNTANYFDGPSVAQGTSGTWFVSGTVTLQDTVANPAYNAKLWDGTTVIASAFGSNAGASSVTSISLSGFITSPAGNLRISVKDSAQTSGKILFNITGNSKDSTITAIRIA